jgi:hypothetical protein
MNSRFQIINIVSKPAKRGVAFIAKQSANFPRFVAMVHGQCFAVRLSFADCANAALLSQHLIVLFKRQAESRFEYTCAVFKWIVDSAWLWVTFPTLSTALVNAGLTVRGIAVCSVFARAKICNRFEVAALNTSLFVYNIFGHGVNLLNRLRCGKARLMRPTSGGPFCILT